MSKKVENQKPFDVVMNEKLLFNDCENVEKYMLKLQPQNYVVKNWFIPIIKEQSDMDFILNNSNDTEWYHEEFNHKFPKPKLYLEHDDKGKLTSVYVLYSKGGKLYKVVSQKDYGVIKSRVELNDKGRLVPYGKCDLVPFEGDYSEYGIKKSRSYYNESESILIGKSDYVNGKKEGKDFRFYKDKRYSYDKNPIVDEFPISEYPNHFEITTIVNGKKNGRYLNTLTLEEGNYVNNKRSGLWKMKGESLKKLIKSFGYLNITQREVVNVNYQNGELIGEFFNDSVKGEFSFGKLNGTLINYNDGYVSRVKQFNGDVRCGYSLSTRGRDIFPQEITLKEHKNNIERTIILEFYDRMIFPPMRRVFDSELTQNDFDFISQYIEGFNKEILKDMYQVSKFYEVDIVENKDIRNGEIEWYDIVDEWYENNNIEGFSLYSDEMETKFNEYIINEFGYPYYNSFKKEKSKWNSKTYTHDNYTINKLELKLPRGWNGIDLEIESFVKDGKRYLVVGDYKNYEFVENDDSNPKVEKLKKESFQRKLNVLQENYESQLKREEEELERIKNQEKELELLKKKEGKTLSSFPMD